MTGPLPRIQLSPTNWTILHWSHYADDLILDAPYQRGSVWTVDQRVALMKSVLMGIPFGSVIVSKLPILDSGPWQRVVDGKQRLETVLAFYDSEFAIPTEWIEPDWIGDPAAVGDTITFAEFSRTGRNLFNARPFPALEFDAQTVWLGRDEEGENQFYHRTDAEMLAAEAELYLLINGGGTAHTDSDFDVARQLAAGAS